MKLGWDGIEWGGPKGDWWSVYWWNWLSKDVRYFGFEHFWYDGPIGSFGWWYGNISWTLPWGWAHRG